MIDQNILIGLLVAITNSLNEIIAFKDLGKMMDKIVFLKIRKSI